MTYIDSAVLNLTEWFCRKFQLLTGRTNVWLAVQLTNLSIVVSDGVTHRVERLFTDAHLV